MPQQHLQQLMLVIIPLKVKSFFYFFKNLKEKEKLPGLKAQTCYPGTCEVEGRVTGV